MGCQIILLDEDEDCVTQVFVGTLNKEKDKMHLLENVGGLNAEWSGGECWRGSTDSGIKATSLQTVRSKRIHPAIHYAVSLKANSDLSLYLH